MFDNHTCAYTQIYNKMQKNSKTTKLKEFKKSKEKLRLDSNIERKSSNDTYLNIIKIFTKFFKKLNIIESQILIITLSLGNSNKCTC